MPVDGTSVAAVDNHPVRRQLDAELAAQQQAPHGHGKDDQAGMDRVPLEQRLAVGPEEELEEEDGNSGSQGGGGHALKRCRAEPHSLPGLGPGRRGALVIRHGGGLWGVLDQVWSGRGPGCVHHRAVCTRSADRGWCHGGM
ncbi:hypothetical protein GCM10025734_71090 [Kitasatospora paranensis]